jgi:hypothetical protein
MLTRSDKIRIIEAITHDGNAKGLLEDVIQGSPSREEVEHFLTQCFGILMVAEKL